MLPPGPVEPAENVRLADNFNIDFEWTDEEWAALTVDLPEPDLEQLLIFQNMAHSERDESGTG